MNYHEAKRIDRCGEITFALKRASMGSDPMDDFPPQTTPNDPPMNPIVNSSSLPHTLSL